MVVAKKLQVIHRERYRHFRENRWKIPLSCVPKDFRDKVASEIAQADTDVREILASEKKWRETILDRELEVYKRRLREKIAKLDKEQWRR
jgi:hypothetical protein